MILLSRQERRRTDGKVFAALWQSAQLCIPLFPATLAPWQRSMTLVRPGDSAIAAQAVEITEVARCGIKFLYKMAENGTFWHIYGQFGWFRGAGDRCHSIVYWFSMTFFEADGLAVGRNASEASCFLADLVILLLPGRTARGRFGTLDRCLLGGGDSGV